MTNSTVKYIPERISIIDLQLCKLKHFFHLGKVAKKKTRGLVSFFYMDMIVCTCRA